MFEKTLSILDINIRQLEGGNPKLDLKDITNKISYLKLLKDYLINIKFCISCILISILMLLFTNSNELIFDSEFTTLDYFLVFNCFIVPILGFVLDSPIKDFLFSWKTFKCSYGINKLLADKNKEELKYIKIEYPNAYKYLYDISSNNKN